jgi:crotonobetainyl-CoA:carnitine CoA-transferase CaiB-like acyl-CoA transferase
LHAVVALMLALGQRDIDGLGRLVESTMVEAVLNTAAEQLVEYGATGRLLSREGNRSALAAPQGVYQCRGDDQWLALAAVTDDHWTALQRIVRLRSTRADLDAIDEELSEWCRSRHVDSTVETLLDAGIPAAVVVSPREIVDNPQLRHRRLFEDEDHPVTGRHAIPALPFRFSRIDRWVHRPSPTLGQHNDEVLTELGFGASVDRLRGLGVIGERL